MPQTIFTFLAPSPSQRTDQKIIASLVNIRELAPAWAGDVEGSDRVFLQPLMQPLSFSQLHTLTTRTSQFHQEDGLLQLLGQSKSQQRSATQSPDREDQRSIRVEDVLPRSMGVLDRFHLLQLVASGDPAILRDPPLRTPATVWNLACDCRIERRSVDTRLSPGDDPVDDRCCVGFK